MQYNKTLNEQLIRIKELAGIKQSINENTISSQDQQVLNDILSENNSLSEAIDFNSVIQKVKNYAAKGLLTATVLAGLMASPALSQEQKAQIKNTVSTNINTPQQQIINITPQVKVEWNKFIDWIAQAYPGGISDGGADPTSQIVSAYKKVNPNSPITAYNIKDFQQELVNHNNKWKTIQPNYHEKGPTLSNPSPVDNRIGSITSKMKFPIVQFEVNGKMMNFGTDIDAAVKAYAQNQDNTPYIDPNLTPAQRFQRNQELRSQGKPIPTVGDMKKQQAGNQSFANNQ